MAHDIAMRDPRWRTRKGAVHLGDTHYIYWLQIAPHPIAAGYGHGRIVRMRVVDATTGRVIFRRSPAGLAGGDLIDYSRVPTIITRWLHNRYGGVS